MVTSNGHQNYLHLISNVLFACFAMSIISFGFDLRFSKNWNHRLASIVSRLCATIHGIVSLMLILKMFNSESITDVILKCMVSLQIVLTIYVTRYAETDKVHSEQIERYYKSNRRIQLIIENCICIVIIISQILAIVYDTFSLQRKTSYFFLTYCCGIMMIVIMSIIHGMYVLFNKMYIKTPKQGQQTATMHAQNDNYNDTAISYKWLIASTILLHVVYMVLLKHCEESRFMQTISIQIQHGLHAMIYIIGIVTDKCSNTQHQIKQSMMTQMNINNKIPTSVSTKPPLPSLVSRRQARRYQNRFPLRLNTNQRPMSRIPENRQYNSPLTTNSTIFSSTFGASTTQTEWFTSPQNSPKVLIGARLERIGGGDERNQK